MQLLNIDKKYNNKMVLLLLKNNGVFVLNKKRYTPNEPKNNEIRFILSYGKWNIWTNFKIKYHKIGCPSYLKVLKIKSLIEQSLDISQAWA